jgi:hypothetical protein
MRGALPKANYTQESALIGNTAAKPKSMEHLMYSKDVPALRSTASPSRLA